MQYPLRSILALACAVTLVSCDAFGGSDDPLSISNEHGPFFGFLLDHEEDYLAVSSYEGDDLRNVVYLFARDADGNWDRGQRIDPDPNEDLNFGWNLAVSGRTAAMTSPKEDNERGAIYVYAFDGTQWQQQLRLSPPVATTGASFAFAGDWIFLGDGAVPPVGQPRTDSTDTAGRVIVYRREGGEWSEHQELRADDEAPFKGFGTAVAVHQNRCLVLASSDGATSILDRGNGVAYIFRLEGERWVQEAKIVPSEPITTGSDLQSVAIGAEWAAVGHASHLYDGGRGVVNLYRREGTSWRHAQRLTRTEADSRGGGSFGTVVKMDGDRLVVSDPFGDTGRGSVYVFELERGGETWQQTARIQAPGNSVGDFFGEGLSVSGEEIVVGAPGVNDEQGAVYVLRRSGSGWDYVEP